MTLKKKFFPNKYNAVMIVCIRIHNSAELFGTINVHLLIVNAIMYFVAPIVAGTFCRVCSVGFISICGTSKSLKTKRRLPSQISYTELFACNYADGSCAALHAVFAQNID